MISGVIKKLQHSSYIKGQRSIAEPPTTNRCLKTKGQVFFGKQKYFMKKNKTLCETESLVSCVGVKVRSLFNFVSFCRELLLSRFWLGASEKLPSWHWWLQLVRKCLSGATSVLANSGRASLRLQLWLSSELPRGSMLCRNGYMSLSRRASELPNQSQTARSVPVLSFWP